MLKLFYFKSADGVPNFGDDLNPWLWRRLLAGYLSEDAPTLLTGIGTILNDRVPKARQTLVFGSGVGFGGGLPQVDASWTIYCVRGPLSAQALGLPLEVAVTDPALLVSGLAPASEIQPSCAYSYMPHYINANDRWAGVCRRLGLGYIDPRQGVDSVFASLRQTRVLIAEAMHGAIVADALGIPWIPVRTGGKGVMEFKWRDWCQSLDLTYAPHQLPPLFPTSRNRAVGAMRSAVAAARLFQISRTAAPQLSDEKIRARRFEQLYTRLWRLKRDVEREQLQLTLPA
jgi:succinoglycan biosynthesis protein ExoV